MAYVSVVTTESDLIPARVLGRSLANLENENVPRLLLVPESLSEHSLVSRIEEEDDWNEIRVIPDEKLIPGNPYVELDSGHCPEKFRKPLSPSSGIPNDFKEKITHSFAKLYIWSLEEYSKVIYLDTDTVVLENVDALFACPALLCAANLYDRPQGKKYEYFHSAVMVIQPNATFHDSLLEELDECRLASYDSTEQGFLNSIFRCYNYRTYEKRLYSKEDCSECFGSPYCQTHFSKLAMENSNDAQSISVSGLFERSDVSESFQTFSWRYNCIPDDGPLSYNTDLEFSILHFGNPSVKPWCWLQLPLYPRHWEWILIRLSLESSLWSPLIQFSIPFIIGAVIINAFYSHGSSKSENYLRSEKPSEYRRDIRNQALAFALAVLTSWVFSLVAPMDSSPVFLWSLTQTVSSLLMIFVFRKILTESEVTVETYVMAYWSSASIIWTPTIASLLFRFGPTLSSLATVAVFLFNSWDSFFKRETHSALHHPSDV